MNLFDQQSKTFIKDLQVGKRVDDFFRIIEASKRAKKDGGSFLTLELMDKTGKIPGKVWNNADGIFKTIKTGEIYRVGGAVNSYKGQKELRVDEVKPVSPQDKDFDEADYTETAAFDTDVLFKKMIATVKANVSDPHLVQLTDSFATVYGEKFKAHYGAQKIHHAYLGGLLEHTESMVRLAVMIADHYDLDKELLLMGVLFHDIGKIFEFNISPAPEMTMAGGLVGHIVMGTSIFLKLKNRIEGFPEALSIKIQHLIVSHHGEKEYGSPEVPRTPEAMALHVIDLLDSKLKIMEDAVDKHEGDGLFTDYVSSLSRRVYKEQG